LAAVAGAGEASHPHGLTPSNWSQPYLVVQAMQFNTGRMSVVVSEATAGK
jgi:hypothetical protein